MFAPHHNSYHKGGRCTFVNVGGTLCGCTVYQTESSQLQAVRVEPKRRYDKITPHILNALAEVFYEGSLIHPEDGDQWRTKGLPTSNYLNHLQAHLAAARSGDTSEDHLAHALWNMAALVHTVRATQEGSLPRHFNDLFPGYEVHPD